LKW
ncbi:putative rTX toxin, partial [Vibrio parahaemolyticus V-223/04]|jgi:hypothetical protein